MSETSADDRGASNESRLSDTAKILVVQVQQLIRYGHGGLLVFGIVALYNPDFIKEIVTSLGGPLSMLMVLSIGAPIYVIHRYVIGEYCIYPLTNIIHIYVWDKISCKLRKIKEFETTSVTGMLEQQGIKVESYDWLFGYFLRRKVYSDWRQAYLPEKKKNLLNLFHAEVHILWISAVIVMGVILSSYMFSDVGDSIKGDLKYWCILFFVLVFSGLVGDIQLHSKQCRDLRSQEADLKKFLEEYGYLGKNTVEVNQPISQSNHENLVG
ncbi:MAG: hypothetical protein HUJ26_10250 [Planctomycetaceae bacterium]|nr:hypothetical protein [Planctomycetaceae bacterium]